MVIPSPQKPDDIVTGEYKKHNNMTFVRNPKGYNMIVLRYVDKDDVRDQVAELVFWVRDNEATVHPIHLASIAHYNTVRIHPFPDGNGRLARLFMNLLFIRHGYNPAVIEPEQREEYMGCLFYADRGDIAPLTEFIASSLIATQNRLLNIGSFVNSK